VDKGTKSLTSASPFLNNRSLRNLWMILSLTAFTFLNVPASGATLYGKVVEVNDGDTITIFNLNRTVKVRLLGVDAPDGEQPYAKEAKQHLATLILHRSVTVEYSGLGQNSYLLGKIFLRETDIGAQMLRDGVAWFDKSTSSRLIDPDRQIYSECEHAARTERRGLWQDAEAIAPWEFKQQLADRALAAQRSGLKESPTQRSKTQTLKSEDLLQSLTGLNGSNSVSRSSTTGEGQWRTLAPEGEHFSIQVPGIGVESFTQVPAGNETANINYWIADYEGASYLVMWTRGPNLTYTDSTAIADMAKGIVSGLNRGLERRGVDIVFDAKPQRDLKLDGYAGSQFSVSSSSVPGMIRAFSKQFGDRREMYIVGVLNSTEENPSVDKFFKSLSFDRKLKL
jgi:micrococcal nuclease